MRKLYEKNIWENYMRKLYEKNIWEKLNEKN